MSKDTYAKKTTVTPIFIDIKNALLKLQEEFPDIKQTHFVSEAVEVAIEKERIRRKMTAETKTA